MICKVRNLALAIVVAAVLPAQLAWADRSLEDAVEALSANVLLPSTGAGKLVVTTCTSCAPSSYQLVAESKFFVGNKQVSLAELAKYFGSTSRYPVLIALKVSSQTVSRIVITGEALPR